MVEKKIYNKIAYGSLFFVTCSLLSIIAPAMVYIDLNILKIGMQEFSFTEISQTFFLFCQYIFILKYL